LRPPTPTFFPYTTLFRSLGQGAALEPARRSIGVSFAVVLIVQHATAKVGDPFDLAHRLRLDGISLLPVLDAECAPVLVLDLDQRSEEHTSELQSPCNLVC